MSLLKERLIVDFTNMCAKIIYLDFLLLKAVSSTLTSWEFSDLDDILYFYVSTQSARESEKTLINQTHFSSLEVVWNW